MLIVLLRDFDYGFSKSRTEKVRLVTMGQLEVSELLEQDFSENNLVLLTRRKFESITGDKLERFTYPYRVVFLPDDKFDGVVRVVVRDCFGEACLESYEWEIPKSVLLN